MEGKYIFFGLLYFNRNDKAVFVKKSNNLGYTLNFGNYQTYLMIGIIVLVGIATIKWIPSTIEVQ